MIAATFLAFVDDTAKIGITDRRAFRALLDRLKGQEVVVSVKKKPRRQGNQSMRYYRGVVVPHIAREAMGITDPDQFQNVHEGLAWKFLRLPDGPMGEPRRKSTSKDEMTQDEITDYISQVIDYANTDLMMDRPIPKPDDLDLDDVIDPGWR